MKAQDLPAVFVVNADQRRSRRGRDRVPDALAALDGLPGLALGFERTAGDEIQGLLTDPDAVVRVVLTLTRLSGWRIGIGVGPVETPLPSSTREARGEAYLAAREAMSSGADVRVVGRSAGVWRADAALSMLVALAGRRTEQGWELAGLLEDDMSRSQIANHLSITRSAVSQRAASAMIEGVDNGARLAADLLLDAILTP